MGNNFDPFGGGSSSNYYNKGNESKPKSNNLVTVVLVIILIGLAIYYGANYLFLSKVDVTFNVKNTEGETIPSVIKIAKDPMVTKVVLNLQNGTTEKIKKGNYYYSVQSSGYASENGKEINIKETTKKDVSLEKNIPLTINSINFPEKVFAGQTATLIIHYRNTSENTAYTIDDLVIEGDVKKWNFAYTDSYSDPISKEQVVLSPRTESTIHVRYTVEETSKKSNKISVRVKYKKKETSKSFEIIQEPDIPITGTLSGELKSGESKNFTITIGNSKNSLPITDLTMEVEVSGNSNQDVNQWFTYPQGNILLDAKKNVTKPVSIVVPQTATDDLIEGKLIFRSSIFKDAKEIPIKFTIKEPSINFTASTNKSTIKLIYDVNNNVTNIEYVTLKLDNESTIDIEIIEIKVVDLDVTRKDCNNLIYISENALANNRVIRNTNPEVLMSINAIDPSLVGSLVNNTRACAINVSYKHPFRSNETLNVGSNLIINIE